MIRAVRHLTCNIGLWVLVVPLGCSILLLLASCAIAGFKNAGYEALSGAHFSWESFAGLIVPAFFGTAACVWGLLIHLTQESNMLLAESAADLGANDRVGVSNRHDV